MNPLFEQLQKKTNFYYPFLLLPPAQRQALETLYRFCWAADEISDGSGSPAEKRRKLFRFKQNLKAAFQGRAQDPLFQKLQGLIPTFSLSREPLERILKGVERDLRPIRFKKFEELRGYALQVAGGPGLASMEIFGFQDKTHRAYAENLGVFLQLVNIVRDFKEDRDMGRQYLPAEDFKRFKLNPFSIEGKNADWKYFVEFQLKRAYSFLEKSRASLSLRERKQLPTAEAIAAVYLRLFGKLWKNPGRILKERITLPKWERLYAVGTSFLSLKTGRG